MNHYLAIFEQPWPIVSGKAQERTIIQTAGIMRALEIALGMGPVVSIGVNDAIPVVSDPRAGAERVEAK